jgi:hypothetical protein
MEFSFYSSGFLSLRGACCLIGIFRDHPCNLQYGTLLLVVYLAIGSRRCTGAGLAGAPAPAGRPAYSPDELVAKRTSQQRQPANFKPI